MSYRSIPSAFAPLTIFAIWLTFSLPWFVTDHIIPWDAKNHFYPMIRFLAASWHNGESFFWSPFHYGGFPMIADPQSGIFTPTLWPIVLLSADPSMGLVDFFHLLHLLVIGLAAYGFGRLRGWLTPIAILVALVAMLGGSVTMRLEHFLMTITVMWFWVALWRLELAILKGGLWRGFLFGLALGLMLLNRDHVAYLCAWVLLTYWLARIVPFHLENRQRPLIVSNLPVLVGGVFSLVIAALPLILLLQLAANSNRPEFSYHEASWQSLHPAGLMSFFVPEFMGSLRQTGSYWGPASFTWGGDLKLTRSMVHFYAGMLPVVAILWLGFINGRLFDRGVRYFTALLIIALIYAFGRHTPIFALLYEIVPGVDLFRRPADATFILIVAVSLVVGELLNRAGLEQSRRVSISGSAIAAIIVTGLLGYGFYLSANVGRLWDSSVALLVSASIAIVLVLFVVRTLRLSSHKTIWWVLIILVVAGDLLYHTSAIRANFRPPDRYYPLQDAASDPVFTEVEKLLEERDPMGFPWRIETLGLGPFVQNIGQAAGYHNLLGYNPLRLKGFETLIAPDMQNNAGNRRKFGTLMTGYNSPLTNQLGLRYLVLGTKVEALDPNVPPARFSLIKTIKRGKKDVYIYKNDEAEPRAALDQPGRIRLINRRNDEVTLEVSSETANRLVLRDFYYPGWAADIDGTPTPIEKADDLFKAVAIPEGKSIVTFSFKPLSINRLF